MPYAAIPRVTLVFLGFPPAHNAPVLAGPSRRVVVDLPHNAQEKLPNGRTPAMLDLMSRVKSEHLADDLAIDLARASVYTGAPDFSLVKPTSPLGLLRDGETLIVVCSYPHQQAPQAQSPMDHGARHQHQPHVQTRDLGSPGGFPPSPPSVLNHMQSPTGGYPQHTQAYPQHLQSTYQQHGVPTHIPQAQSRAIGSPNNYAMSPSIQSPMMAMNYNTNQFGHPGSPGMVMAHPQQYAQTPAGHMSAYPHQQHPYAGTSYPSPTSPTQFQQPPPPKPLHGGWGEQPDVPTVNVSLADHAERSHRHHRHHHHHHHRHHRSSSRKRRSSRHDLEHDDYHDDHHDARHDAHHDVHHEDGGRNRPSTGSPVRKTQVDERHGSPARPSTRLDDAHRPKAGQSPTKSGHEHDEHAESPTLKGNAKLPTKPLLLHTDAFDHNDDHDHGGVHSVRVSKVERKGHEAEQEPKRNSTVKVTTERKAAPSPVKPPVKKDVHDEEHFFDEPTPSKGKMGSPKKPAHGDEHHDHSTNHEETGASAKRTSTVKPPGTRDLEGHEEERKERVSLGTTSHPSKDVNIDDAHTAAGGTSKTRGAPKNQKKALLIGISYRDKDNRTAKVNKAGVSVLENSIGDVLAVKKMLTDNFGYADAPDQMRVLVDDSEDPARRPTRQNILKELEWLRQGAKAGDQLYLHFCGHGSVPHSAKGSLDELDDGLLPCDYEKGAGKPRVAEITDRDMNTYLVHGLPKGVKVTCVLDCLQQNTLLDLPFVYNQEGYYKGTPEIREEHEAQGNRSSEADVILLSACKDESQTGVDVSSKPEGAITHGLIEAVNEAGRKDKPIKDMVKLVRQVLLKKSKYTHRPQLSAGHNVNMSGEFFFGKGDS